MRRDKVLRFLVVAFALGAFLGLVSGLAFGGGSSSATPKASAAKKDAANAVVTVDQGSPSTTVAPMTAERARAIGANEMGYVPVLCYHHFGDEETDYTRTYENFRDDIALLKSEGFYPINVRDLASGNIDIPAGKSPVVLTFDDSSPGQYRILDDGTLDPDSAVGIMQAAVEAGDWASKGSFFCLLDVTPSERILFGQTDRRQEKLRNLVNWGYEVGSHTVSHLNLRKASFEEASKQLAQSKATLEKLIGGSYSVNSLAVPFTDYPEDDSLIASGEYDGVTYAYTAALNVDGSASFSPYSTKFRPLHISRITASHDYVAQAIARLKANPQLRYISDGDPTTVSAPLDLDPKLGELLSDLGRPVIRY
jgi:peptidoglycan/xylan/chitin deacetylase (PgdA/CDA1 family)